jgi:hypothetical protein
VKRGSIPVTRYSRRRPVVVLRKYTAEPSFAPIASGASV